MKTHQTRKPTPEIQFQHMNSEHILHLAVLAFCRGKKRNKALTQCSSSTLNLLLGESEEYEINSVSILPGKNDSELLLRINRDRDLLFPNIHSRTRTSEWLQPFLRKKPYKLKSSNFPPVSAYFLMEEKTVETNEKPVEQPEALGQHQRTMEPVPPYIPVSSVQLLKVLQAYLATTPLKEQRQPAIEYYLALCKTNLKKREYLDHPVDRWPDSAWHAFFQVLQQRMGEVWTHCFLPDQDEGNTKIVPVYHMNRTMERADGKPFNVCLVFYPVVEPEGFLEYKVFLSMDRYRAQDRKLLQEFPLREGEKLDLPSSRKVIHMSRKGEEEATGAFRRFNKKGDINVAATLSHLQILLDILIASSQPDDDFEAEPSFEEAQAHLYRDLFRQVFGHQLPKNEKDLSYASAFIRLCLGKKEDYAIHSVKVLRLTQDADLWIEVNEELVLVLINEFFCYRVDSLIDRMKRHHRKHATQMILVHCEMTDSTNFVELHVPEIRMVKRNQVLSLLEDHLSTTPSSKQYSLLMNHYMELDKIDWEVNNYGNKFLFEWNNYSWNGFFRDLQLELGGYREPYSSESGGPEWRSKTEAIRIYKGQHLIKNIKFYLNLRSDGQNGIYLDSSYEDWEDYTAFLWEHLKKQEQRLGTIPFPVDRGEWGEMNIKIDFRSPNGKGLLDMEDTVLRLRSWLRFLETMKLSICADYNEEFTVLLNQEIVQLN